MSLPSAQPQPDCILFLSSRVLFAEGKRVAIKSSKVVPRLEQMGWNTLGSILATYRNVAPTDNAIQKGYASAADNGGPRGIEVGIFMWYLYMRSNRPTLRDGRVCNTTRGHSGAFDVSYMAKHNQKDRKQAYD